MKKYYLILLTIFGVVIALGTVFLLTPSRKINHPSKNTATPPPLVEATTYTKNLTIDSGKTYSVVMQEAGIDAATSQAIFNASHDIYNLSALRAGHTLTYTYDKKTNSLVTVLYPINDDEELEVSKDTTATTTAIWAAEKKKIIYDIRLKTLNGTINDSLYADGLKAGIPEGTLIEFANIFEYAIDYAYDIRTGDMFSLLYEERYRDGMYIMPGRVLAGKFVNAGHPYLAYYFAESADNTGYFDESGNSLQKMFLRAPVAFKFISSGFTTGKRYVSAFNVSTGHRAIDYATPLGTPIRAVGAGTVVFAGWSTAGYGNLTSIRHNSTYTTNYAHQSKILVKKGQHVEQGQIIGKVGSTGFSTGPHLHFEMVKNGVKINPLKEVLPPGKPILEENKDRFLQEKERLDGFLK